MKKSLLIFISILLFSLTQQTMIAKGISFEKGSTKIEFGGFVRSVVFSDFSGTIQHLDFRNASIAVPNQWHNQDRVSFDASASRLSLKGVTNNERVGPIEFVIESDFRGVNDAFRIRHAYISLKGFIFGQTWSFMTDVASNAPTIDVMGVNSRTFIRTPLIGYRYALDKNTTIGASLEFPVVKYTVNNEFRTVTQAIPDLPIYLNHKFNSGHLKITALFRALEYGINSTSEIKTKLGYGMQLSGSFKATSGLTLYSQGILGEGVARYINDLSIVSLDLVPDKNNKEMQTLPMYSISLGAKVDFNKELYATANIARASLIDKERYYSANEYFSGN